MFTITVGLMLVLFLLLCCLASAEYVFSDGSHSEYEDGGTEYQV
jgi:hypothetical protein